jgi:hypothetical protein
MGKSIVEAIWASCIPHKANAPYFQTIGPVSTKNSPMMEGQYLRRMQRQAGRAYGKK